MADDPFGGEPMAVVQIAPPGPTAPRVIGGPAAHGAPAMVAPNASGPADRDRAAMTARRKVRSPFRCRLGFLRHPRPAWPIVPPMREIPNRHHHRRQDRCAPGGCDSGAGRAALRLPGTAAARAEIRRDDPARARSENRRRRHPPGRSLCPARQDRCRASPTRRGSPSSSAGLASAPSAPVTRIAKLPGPVTLAFVPYGADLDHLAGAGARAPATRFCCRCRWSRSTIRTTIPARRRC